MHMVRGRLLGLGLSALIRGFRLLGLRVWGLRFGFEGCGLRALHEQVIL